MQKSLKDKAQPGQTGDFISKAAGPPADISQLIRNLRKLRRCIRANQDLSTDQKKEFLGYIGKMEVSIELEPPRRGPAKARPG